MVRRHRGNGLSRTNWNGGGTTCRARWPSFPRDPGTRATSLVAEVDEVFNLQVTDDPSPAELETQRERPPPNAQTEGLSSSCRRVIGLGALSGTGRRPHPACSDSNPMPTTRAARLRAEAKPSTPMDDDLLLSVIQRHVVMNVCDSRSVSRRWCPSRSTSCILHCTRLVRRRRRHVPVPRIVDRGWFSAMSAIRCSCEPRANEAVKAPLCAPRDKGRSRRPSMGRACRKRSAILFLP